MKTYRIKLAFILLSLAIVLHIGHYIIFRNLHHLLIFLVSDLAFIPIEVLVVTLFIDKGLERREREHRIEKINILIGLFYDEVGTKLLARLVDRDAAPETVNKIHDYFNKMLDSDFKSALRMIEAYPHKINVDKVNFYELKDLLAGNKPFIVQMMANPTLLEHETFTDLLQSLIHLMQELNFRCSQHSSQDAMDDIDIKHLKADIERVYHYLTIEWTYYMQHLKEQYPFLFFTALLHNPYGTEQSHEFEQYIRFQLDKLNMKKA